MNEIVEGVYLGDIHDAKNHGEGIDVVISVARNYTENTDYHKPLKDSNSIDSQNFKGAVELVRTKMKGEGSVLVHCIVGSSRSPSVLAAAIASERGEGFRDVLGEIEEVRGCVNPIPEVAECGEEYVETLHGTE